MLARHSRAHPCRSLRARPPTRIRRFSSSCRFRTIGDQRALRRPHDSAEQEPLPIRVTSYSRSETPPRRGETQRDRLHGSPRKRRDENRRRDREHRSKTERTEASRDAGTALWTTVSGFESLPPSQSSKASRRKVRLDFPDRDFRHRSPRLSPFLERNLKLCPHHRCGCRRDACRSRRTSSRSRA